MSVEIAICTQWDLPGPASCNGVSRRARGREHDVGVHGGGSLGGLQLRQLVELLHNFTITFLRAMTDQGLSHIYTRLAAASNSPIVQANKQKNKIKIKII